MKSAKFKASQSLIKRNTSNYTLGLTKNFNIQINGNTAIDNNKCTNLSKIYCKYLSYLGWGKFLAFFTFGARANGYSRFSSSAFLPFFVFSFTIMLYVISLAKTSVTYNEAVNRVNFLEVLL